jgi:hypothetical protein
MRNFSLGKEISASALVIPQISIKGFYRPEKKAATKDQKIESNIKNNAYPRG